MKHFINGFTYGEKYFKSLLSPTEYERCLAGEVITKNDNSFWIEVKDDER